MPFNEQISHGTPGAVTLSYGREKNRKMPKN
jgi:hypothetical protein